MANVSKIHWAAFIVMLGCIAMWLHGVGLSSSWVDLWPDICIAGAAWCSGWLTAHALQVKS